MHAYTVIYALTVLNFPPLTVQVIKESGPLEYPEGGYEAVEASNDGHFAFIHDAAEVRYQYYKNCNFLEVGEPFAEQPLVFLYAFCAYLLPSLTNFILGAAYL